MIVERKYVGRLFCYKIGHDISQLKLVPQVFSLLFMSRWYGTIITFLVLYHLCITLWTMFVWEKVINQKINVDPWIQIKLQVMEIDKVFCRCRHNHELFYRITRRVSKFIFLSHMSLTMMVSPSAKNIDTPCGWWHAHLQAKTQTSYVKYFI